MFDVLPLRTIAIQLLFVLIAIAIEALVFYRKLGLDYRSSIQYSASINLFSTFLGWVIFFNAQHYLTKDLRHQLISYVFFARFFSSEWSARLNPIIILTSFGIFMGTFLVELGGVKLLDALLEKTPQSDRERLIDRKVRRQHTQYLKIQADSQGYAVLLANALSFSAILFLLLVRGIEQNYYSK